MHAVHFGAGNIGRGFIGFILSKANYHITFVDVNKSMINHIHARQRYTVQFAEEEQRSFEVTNIHALETSNEMAVTEAIIKASLITTAVGVHILKQIAPSIAEAIRQRAKLNRPPLTIVACENAIRASSILKELVSNLLDDKISNKLHRFAVFPDAAVDRIVPIQHHEDPLLVTVEPFYEWTIERKLWLDSLPEISGVHYVENLDPYIERKLFTVNTGHCAVAYIGQRYGYATIQEAMKDHRIVTLLRQVLSETGASLISHYHINPIEHQAYIEQIIERFQNYFLTDEIKRVGRSPIRKLSPNDRFMRPIELAKRYHLELNALPQVMAAAFLFQAEDDPEVNELQHTIEKLGISAAITQYTGLQPSDPLHNKIIEQYNHFLVGLCNRRVCHMTTISNGISASPGIAIAKAVVINYEEHIPSSHKVENASDELLRFQHGKEAAKLEIQKIYQQTLQSLGAEKAEIFEGHLLILEDPDLIENIETLITKDNYNAEYALYNTTNQFIDMLLALDDELLRARSSDIKDITQRIMNHLRGVSSASLSQLQEHCVIVTHDLTPSDTAQLNLQLTAGFITEVGSRTSHSAIMARSLELPAIVGIGDEIMKINHGDLLVLDAIHNRVIINPDEKTLTEYYGKIESDQQRQEHLRKLVYSPTCTLDQQTVELAANIGKLEDIDRAIANGAEGIGLFRTEFIYMGRQELPTEEEQFQIYRAALEKMNGKPVVIRTLDIGGDKELPYLNLPKELNPFLGQRALRFCLANPAVFRAQLRALLRASVYGNLKIMFPMIAVLEELLEAKQILDEEKQQLQKEGFKINEQIEIGMMVEIPSVAITADTFAPHVDFFSIGTNDLIQYTMAADRMNESLSYLYQPLHPSILRLIRMVITAANENGKWVGMCGEMAGDSAAIPILLGLGLDEFSMSSSAILSARSQISQLNKADWTSLAHAAMTLSNEQQVIDFVLEQQR